MRIAIVEDEPMLLENMRLLLGGEKGIAVEGAFNSGEKALAGLRNLQPDIILTDIGLPNMSGIELIKRIKSERPEIDIMAFTIYEDKEMVFSALKAGASGYVLKGCTPRELIESLHELHAGGAPMSPRIARAVIREFHDETVSEPNLLTQREIEVLKGIEKGATYKELANELCISQHTVNSHIKNIYEKLHAKSKQEAVSKARKKGIL